ncbi:HMG_box domain protein [Indivirus ILV1]|uniref:HMG_box domain protein n=1 Tax=Indivirus ILV1 TaxID=1977633 RepID=A0A1V0SEM4_9VIRU|nr:HMG_box domain protein [Indivirus ILV1]
MSNDMNIKMIMDMIMNKINSHVKDITSERFFKQWMDESNQETMVEELSSINFKEVICEEVAEEGEEGEDDESKIIKIFNTFKYEKRRELIKKLSDSIPDSNNIKKTKVQKNTGRKKAVRKPKKKNALKRPMSAYLLFCSDEREVIKREHPEMKSKDIMKESAIRWKRINKEDKQVYIIRNEELKIEYQEKKEQLKNEGEEGEEEGEEEGDDKKVVTRSRNKKQKKEDEEGEEEVEEEGEDKKVKPRIRNKKQKKEEEEGEEDEQEERNTPVKKTRKVSGYVLYCREVRNKFKEENPGMSGKEIVKLINNSWSDLSKEEKNGYST